MLNKRLLAEMDARNQESPNEDVTALLAEVHELKRRQMQPIRWIGTGVVPKLKTVWRYLLYQKSCPKECLVLDKALSSLEGDLRWLVLPSQAEQGET